MFIWCKSDLRIAESRYMGRQLWKTEKTSTLDCAPANFDHLLAQGADTCLAKILGVFQVRTTMSAGNRPIVWTVLKNLNEAPIKADMGHSSRVLSGCVHIKTPQHMYVSCQCGCTPWSLPSRRCTATEGRC